MFSYHAVALSGSHAYAATSPRGRSISIVLVTSTAMCVTVPAGRPARRLRAAPEGAGPVLVSA